MAVFKPYQLVSREAHPENTNIKLNGLSIGDHFQVIAGMCSVETEEVTLRIAKRLNDMGVKIFRAGAYKPRTSPYSFQGLGKKGLDILQKVKDETGMLIATEVLDIASLDEICKVADIVQIGTRNMSNTSLLKAVGKIDKPVLLKRGMSATLDEFLMAAEYILLSGNPNVILCERGIRTFNDHCRATLDIAAIPALQEKTHLPVIVDPSHAAGTTDLVAPLACAAIAAGAQGLLIEAHDNAEHAYSDGQQALHPDELEALMDKINGIRQACRFTDPKENIIKLEKDIAV